MLKVKRGFTLIELLIVIVIIGILAGIVVGIVGTNAKKKANDTKKKADFHEIQNALEQYFVDNDYYPAVATWGADLVAANLMTTDPSLTAAGSMVAQSGGKPYVYSSTSVDADGNVTGYRLEVELDNQGDNGANVEVPAGGTLKVYYVTSKQ